MGTHGVRGVAPEEETFREVLGHFASGVVAVTGMAPDGNPTGLTISSFTAVSLEPLLVSFCIGRTSRTWPLLRASDSICINILSEHQQNVSACLARSGGKKFSGLGWSRSPGGLPLLDGTLAWLEGTVDAQHQAGDHDIVVTQVRDLGIVESSGPLIHYRGAYRRLNPS
ncbi:flavin reductase family protein [Streptomyces sp. NBC_01233]|uniref:flavin reductase family protein n=1 Tax=Streptomyces sp. NBC_01233 TaxID=2903787 RepID=UPI002E11C7B1|nr:flavin reductase family protein [Streptomyces sp. NBC_01233]